MGTPDSRQLPVGAAAGCDLLTFGVLGRKESKSKDRSLRQLLPSAVKFTAAIFH
jgi:hypothetical protein